MRTSVEGGMNLSTFTSHDIFGGCISVGSHHTGRNMSFVTLGTIFGESKIRKFCIEVLKAYVIIMMNDIKGKLLC